MIISRKHRFIFVKSRKTAGSSIQVTLSKICQETDFIKESQITNNSDLSYFHQRKIKIYSNLFETNLVKKRRLVKSHTTLKQLKFILKEDYDSFFKFAFIRNPWDLVVYRYFWDKYKNEHDFNNFNRWLEDNYQLQLWEKDQLHLYTHINDEFKLDFVGRYENIEVDFKFVCEKLNLGKFKLSNEKRIRQDKKHYTKYYSEKSKQIVAKLFYKDIEYFDYKFGDN